MIGNLMFISIKMTDYNFKKYLEKTLDLFQIVIQEEKSCVHVYRCLPHVLQVILVENDSFWDMMTYLNLLLS